MIRDVENPDDPMLDCQTMKVFEKKTPLTIVPLLLLLAALVLLGGCERSELTDVERQQIETTLATYLPKLAEAYATREPGRLTGLASGKEIASVQKLIEELADRGEAMAPELVSFTIESAHLWRSTVFVSTLEIWDLRRRATGTEVVLQEYLGQRNRVNYHLERAGESWVVLRRQVLDRDLE
jgi:hypothetical protein